MVRVPEPAAYWDPIQQLLLSERRGDLLGVVHPLDLHLVNVDSMATYDCVHFMCERRYNIKISSLKHSERCLYIIMCSITRRPEGMKSSIPIMTTVRFKVQGSRFITDDGKVEVIP